MGKLTISMAIFNSYVSLPEGISLEMVIEMDFSMVIFIEANGTQLIWLCLHTWGIPPNGYLDKRTW